MTAALQFIVMRQAGWILFEPSAVAEEAPVARAAPRHSRRHDGNTPQAIPAETPFAAPAPNAANLRAREDKIALRAAKGDKEHGIVNYNDKTKAMKELNIAAFENDSPWGRRQTRASLGHSALKARYWR